MLINNDSFYKLLYSLCLLSMGERSVNLLVIQKVCFLGSYMAFVCNCFPNLRTNLTIILGMHLPKMFAKIFGT